MKRKISGGTDYTVLEIKYTSIFGDWMVLFEKDDKQYVCAIGEVCTSFTICNAAVWEKLEKEERKQVKTILIWILEGDEMKEEKNNLCGFMRFANT